MTYSDIAESVRDVVAAAHRDEDIRDVVERVRAAIVNSEAVSLFGLETEHAGLGRVHWIVGHPSGDSDAYMVVAIGSHSETGEAWPLFTASASDLSEAFRQLIAECGAPRSLGTAQAAA